MATALMVDRALDRHDGFGSMTLSALVDAVCGNAALAWLHDLKPWRVRCLISTAVRLGYFADHDIVLRPGCGFVRVRGSAAARVLQ